MLPLPRQCAHQLIASGLSAGGYATAAVIMGPENILAAREDRRGAGYLGRAVASRLRDPELYFSDESRRVTRQTVHHKAASI